MAFNLKIILFFLICSPFIYGQINEVNPPDFIKTITFKSNTNESQLPILKLGERLNLEFDALNGDEDDYYYVIEHFNFDWTPSILMKQEYIDGFDNLRIRDYENSFNTYQIFSHYQLQIPNPQTRLRVTGNYLIKIFNSDDELMFSRKFMVFEEKTSVAITIRRSRDVSSINQKQVVDFRVNSPIKALVNPMQTVKTVVIQNNNLRNVVNTLKPKYTIGNDLIYQQNNASSFWGGNEYLFFENKDIRGATSAIQYIDLKDLYHNYLYDDQVRANRPYTFNPDINGNFLITALNTDNLALEADYAVIHFSLLQSELPDGKEIYVYGNFNNYGLDDSNKMIYNNRTKKYEAALLFKQGFYNYKYVVVDKNGDLDEGAISGNFDETENNYKVLVYYRALGERYDRIIGFGEANSVNITN
ncbi:DUF5103 domain-containing protein [Flavobacteriaceae bacterium AU392]|nr:DUF5103 domain-containing protein [Flavobacteriaceae bacterium]RKM82859.1 DUF5103 domain-containing protein [Flavobacteriaceae bacterium AU392]